MGHEAARRRLCPPAPHHGYACVSIERVACTNLSWTKILNCDKVCGTSVSRKAWSLHALMYRQLKVK
jgi:hypothetical protein